MSNSRKVVTELLTQVGGAEAERAVAQLMPLVYDELRAQAAHILKGERKNHTLQPTALVHEAYIRLADQSRVDWQGKTHFMAVGASMMRRVLIDYARGRKRDKRGGQAERVLLEDSLILQEPREIDLLDVNEAIEALAALDPEQAKIVELRFFGGLTVEEVAHVLGVSKRKVEGDWTHAKAWLRQRLGQAETT